jgi:hypothetical protein
MLHDNYRGRYQQAIWLSSASLTDLKLHERLKQQIVSGQPLSLKSLVFPVAGHNVTKGKGDLLTYQDYFQGWPDVTGMSNFAQFTMVFPTVITPLMNSSTPGGLTVVPDLNYSIGASSGPLVFFSEGSFPHFCFGYAQEGKISIVTKGQEDPVVARHIYRNVGQNDALLAHIWFEVPLVGWRDGKQGDCGRCAFYGSLVFRKEQISSILSSKDGQYTDWIRRQYGSRKH